MIFDRYNRVHDYLRISITDNCNLRCFYCMPAEDYDFTPASKLMQVGEIADIAAVFTSLGVKKIRITGGEPLVRKDAAAILLELSRLPVQLTMTTNASRAHEFIDVFRQSRIQTVNISLDTLDADRFRMLTRRDLFEKVRQNINLLISEGINVKINMVVMRGINDAEITSFIRWTATTPIQIRFIEFMPFSGNQWRKEVVFTAEEILSTIRREFSVEKLEDAPHATDKKYQVPQYAGSFSVISTMSAPFCSSCNRMRLTADGKLKNCLFSKTETDLLGPFRLQQPIEPLICQSISEKEKELGGQFNKDYEQLDASLLDNRSMITIGG